MDSTQKEGYFPTLGKASFLRLAGPRLPWKTDAVLRMRVRFWEVCPRPRLRAYRIENPALPMKSKLTLPILTLLLAVFGQNASADTVVSSSGNFDGWIVLYSGQAFGVSWIQSSEFTNVSISAELTGFGSTTQTGRAFLTTKLGLGTTVADQVAFQSFTFPSNESSVTLFSGLDLPAGTYFLSLVGDSPSYGSGWVVSQSPSIQSGPGDSFANDYGFRSPTTPFLPSSDVWVDPGKPNFSVTGTNTVPEPTAFCLLLIASPFLATMRRRKTA